MVGDVRVGIVEAGQHRSTLQLDHPRAGTLELEHLAAAYGHHQPTRNREMAARPQTAPSQNTDAAAREDQVSFHLVATVIGPWRRSTSAPTP